MANYNIKIKELADLFYKSGDVVSIPNTDIMTAFVTASSTEIHVQINLQKRLDNISSATITSAISSFRSATGGYVLGNAYDMLSNSTNVEVTIVKQLNCIRIRFINSNGWGITNNTIFLGPFGCSLTLN